VAAAPAVAADAPATQAPAGLQSLIDAARQEGQLSLIWGEGTMGGSDGVRKLAEGFNRAYGLNLQVQYTPGPSMSEMLTKTTQEFQSNRRSSTDVQVGFGLHVASLMRTGALLAVDWTSWAPNVRQRELLAPDGVAVIFQTTYGGIAYNSARLTGDAVPRTLADLLKPQYKGRIASTPYAANFDYLATDEMWGEQRTLDYLTSLTPQLAGLIRCNETDRLLTGEFDILAIDCTQANTLQAMAQGAPLGFVIPADAPMLLPSYVMIPKNAAHPNAAQLWVNYVLSREAQDVLYETERMDAHLVDGSKTARDIEPFRQAGVQFVTTDAEYVLRQDEAQYNRARARALEILRGQ
jgi:iron(III) transport system substrate-binding protein